MRIKYLVSAAVAVLISQQGFPGLDAQTVGGVTACDDPAPRALLYTGFGEDERDAKKPNILNGKAGAPINVVMAAYADGRIGQGLAIAKGVEGRKSSMMNAGAHRMDLRRGTVCFWIKLNSAVQEGPPEIACVYPGPPIMNIGFTPTRILPQRQYLNGKDEMPGDITFHAGLGYTWGGHYEVETRIGTGGFKFEPGEWHHVAWTWAGIRQSVYLDGKLAKEMTAVSPFPPEQFPEFRIGTAAGGKQDIVIDELATYNFAFTPAEAQAAFAMKESAPIKPIDKHGLTVTADWGPGELKAHITADSGNDFEKAAACMAVELLDGKGETLGTGKIEPLRRGFGEALVPLKSMPAGRYVARVRLLGKDGKEIAAKESVPYELPEAEWLGNKLGLTDAIQPPWTPIEVKGTSLSVWGRRHELAGGFGLPTQIVSQGEELLSTPVSLEIRQDGKPLIISDAKVAVAMSAPGTAEWNGSASAGDLSISLSGRLEYDGMMLIKLTVAPKEPKSPVKLDAVSLETVLPSKRALYANTATDQGYWWYPYRKRIPAEAGVFHTNLKQQAGRTPFLFYVLFSDDDRALEWFADKPENWQIDYKQPFQILSRLENGDVRLQCLLANTPFTLDRPLEFTFGYEATPTKPLPPDWRGAYVHYLPITAWPGTPPVNNDLALWWIWSDSRIDKARGGTFNLAPDDPETFNETTHKNHSGIKIAPFTNQHVIVPAAPHNKLHNGGWDYLNQILQAETSNDGWTAMPSRGMRDYWAWQVNKFIARGGIDSIYIDEANCQTVSANILSGSGYIKADGTHGVGHNTLGMREQIKRTRQLFIDNKKRPLVWLPIYGMIMPHAYAFVDVGSEGESFMFEKPEDPDWMDQWGSGAKSGSGAGPGDWLLGIGTLQKFGMVPIFLNYLKFWNRKEYVQASRTQYALLGLLDIIPMNVHLGWWFLERQKFGITDPDVKFHRYFEQKTFTAKAPEVKISYYSAKGRALLNIANCSGEKEYDGPISVDWKELGLDPKSCSVTNIVGHPSFYDDGKETAGSPTEYSELPLDGNGGFAVKIPRHDFWMVRIDPGQAPPEKTK